MLAVYAWWSYCSIHRPCSLFDWGLGAEVSYRGSEIYRIYPCLRQSGRGHCEGLRRTVPLSCSYRAWRTRASKWRPRGIIGALLPRDEAGSGPKNYSMLRRRNVRGRAMLQDLWVQCRERSKRCVVPALQLLFRWLRWSQSSFCSWSFRSNLSLRLDHCISRANIYNMYDTRRLPYVGDPCRVDNGFDQPSSCGLGVGKAALRGTRLS